MTVLAQSQLVYRKTFEYRVKLHPVIRIICFLFLIGGLATSSKLLFIVAVPVFFWLFKIYGAFASVHPLLKRLQWLFWSLLILNLWFSSPASVELPTMAKVWFAVERVVALLLIVLAAHLLLTTTSTHEIIAALQWWFHPFNKIGFPVEKLAVRLALVLDTVQTVQPLYFTTSRPNASNAFQTLSDRAALLFAQTVAQAENAPLRLLEIPELRSPPWWQWFYPLFILVLTFL